MPRAACAIVDDLRGVKSISQVVALEVALEFDMQNLGAGFVLAGAEYGAGHLRCGRERN